MVTALWIGLGVAVFGALCAFLIPRVWSRSTVALSGPLISSVLVEGFDPYVQPQILLMPEEVDALTAPSRREAFAEFVAWQKKSGGISLGWQSMRLTLRGRGPEPVIITKIQPRVLTRDRPLGGWFVAPELGGGQHISIVIADLDAPNPVADLLARDEERTVIGLTRNYAFTVSDTDVEHIEVHAFTTIAYVTWGVDIHFEAGGKGGTVEVRDDRLRLTAESPQSRAVYEDSNGRLAATAKWGEGFSEPGAEKYRTMKRI